jgi:integrase
MKKIDTSPIKGGIFNLTVDKKRGRQGERHYWRARTPGRNRKVIWAGWATRDDAIENAMDAAKRPESDSSQSEIIEFQTIHDLMAAWMDSKEANPELSPKTIIHYEKAARHIVQELVDHRLGVFGQRQLEKYRNIRSKQKASPRLIVQEFKVLHMAWKWAQDCGHIDLRDLPKIHIKVEGYVRDRVTPDRYSVDQVIEKLDGEWRRFFEILALTGARPSEVSRLKVSDYDPRKRILKLDGKTGEREFPVPKKDARIFDGIPSSPDADLLTLGVSAKTQGLRDQIKKACKAAGVKYFSPYGLRRMVVSQMIRGGVDPATAARVTGHSVEVMLKVYYEANDEDIRRAVLMADLGTPTESNKVVEFPAINNRVVT